MSITTTPEYKALGLFANTGFTGDYNTILFYNHASYTHHHLS